MNTRETKRTREILSQGGEFGPKYGFASISDIYMANDGRLVGMRVNLHVLELPLSKRNGLRLLVPDLKVIDQWSDGEPPKKE